MTREYNPVISVRIPQPMIDIIDAAVATGRYRNRAEYIMAALRFYDDQDHASTPAHTLDTADNVETLAGGGGN